MKNKWRHIRDNFMRHKNQGKSGDAAPAKKKKYVYAEALTFLLNSMEKRPTSGNILEGDEGPEGNLQEEQDIDTVDEVAADMPLQPPKPATKVQMNKSSKMSPFQHQLLATLSSSSAAEEDPDRLYILSLLSDYKKLNEDDKLDFKMMNLQFFQNVRRRKKQQTGSPTPYQHQPFQSQPHLQYWNQPNFAIPGPSQQRLQNQFTPSNESSYSSAVSPNESVFSYNSDQ